jgi:hypothetical protein
MSTKFFTNEEGRTLIGKIEGILDKRHVTVAEEEPAAAPAERQPALSPAQRLPEIIISESFV